MDSYEPEHIEYKSTVFQQYRDFQFTQINVRLPDTGARPGPLQIFSNHRPTRIRSNQV